MERDGGVPWVAHRGDLRVRVPDVFAHIGPDRRRVGVHLDVVPSGIAPMSACPPEVAASHAPGHRVGRLDVLGPRQPEVSVEAFVLVGVVGDDVIGSTELAEAQLYARARRLPGLDEDEPRSRGRPYCRCAAARGDRAEESRGSGRHNSVTVETRLELVDASDVENGSMDRRTRSIAAREMFEFSEFPSLREFVHDLLRGNLRWTGHPDPLSSTLVEVQSTTRSG